MCTPDSFSCASSFLFLAANRASIHFSMLCSSGRAKAENGPRPGWCLVRSSAASKGRLDNDWQETLLTTLRSQRGFAWALRRHGTRRNHHGQFARRSWRVGQTVTNSTFSSNMGSPGGIFNFLSSASIKSTILASSMFPPPPVGLPSANCGGTITDAGYNISDDLSCGFAKTGSANKGDGVNPLLSASGPADNGGPTQTIALQSGSPAIDAIPVADCTDQASPPSPITTDQRGLLPPDAGEQLCDIGAYEFQDFAGETGQANCFDESVRTLTGQFGSLDAAASALGYSSVRAIQNAISAFCKG
jgi:hypothetical protein